MQKLMVKIGNWWKELHHVIAHDYHDYFMLFFSYIFHSFPY